MEIAVYLLLIAVCLGLIYSSGKKKDGFARYFSRGFFMRDLNKKMERDKPGDTTNTAKE